MSELLEILVADFYSFEYLFLEFMKFNILEWKY
jgi:hypothetical protein